MSIETSIYINLAGNLVAQARRYSQALGGLAQNGQRHLTRLSRASHILGRGLDNLSNRYTALFSGAALAGAARLVVGLEERFVRLGITAGATDEQVQALKRSIYEVAQAPKIRVDAGEITSAVEEIVEKTGDLAFAQENIRNIGVAIQATNARGGDIGAVLSEMQKMGLTRPADVMAALDTLNLQGKAGAFTLNNLAALGPRVFAAYGATGRTGPTAVREMGAVLQTIRQGTGSSEQATTAFEAMLRTLSDPQKLKQLRQVGIQVFDPQALKEGRREMRSIVDIMEEIIRKSNGDQVKIGSIFDAEAVRAFNSMISEFKRTGGLESLEKFYAVQGTGAQTNKDAARAAHTAAGGIQSIVTAGQKFADDNLSAPINGATSLLEELGPKGASRVVGGTAVGAGTITGLLGLRAGYRGAKWLRGFLRPGAAAGSATEGAGAAVGVGEGAAAGAGKTAANVARTGGRWLSRFGWVGRRLGWLGLAAAGGMKLYNTWTGDGSLRDKLAGTAGVGGGIGGGVVGAKTGAAVGTMLWPGVGTVLGGMAGGGLGWYAGESLAEQASRALLGSGDSAGEGATAGRLEISIDTAPGLQVVDTRLTKSGPVDIEVERGMAMGGAW